MLKHFWRRPEKSNQTKSIIGELGQKQYWLYRMGLKETDYIIFRPITQYLNNHHFDTWDQKRISAIKFAQERQYTVNRRRR